MTTHAVDLKKLSPFQRVIMTTDGTLTDMLEAWLQESIHIVKLSEQTLAITESLTTLDLPAGETVIRREVLLQGQRSKQNWLYAESILVPVRLDKAFQDDLLHSLTPIGKLWLLYRIETFKDILCYDCHAAMLLATHFDISPADLLLSRTYRVFSQKQPIMMITEKFPASCFQT